MVLYLTGILPAEQQVLLLTQFFTQYRYSHFFPPTIITFFLLSIHLLQQMLEMRSYNFLQLAFVEQRLCRDIQSLYEVRHSSYIFNTYTQYFIILFLSMHYQPIRITGHQRKLSDLQMREIYQLKQIGVKQVYKVASHQYDNIQNVFKDKLTRVRSNKSFRKASARNSVDCMYNEPNIIENIQQFRKVLNEQSKTYRHGDVRNKNYLDSQVSIQMSGSNLTHIQKLKDVMESQKKEWKKTSSKNIKVETKQERLEQKQNKREDIEKIKMKRRAIYLQQNENTQNKGKNIKMKIEQPKAKLQKKLRNAVYLMD